MTLENRLEIFQKGLQRLQNECGITLKADIETEKLGDAVLSRPMLQAIPIPDWQPETTHPGAAEAE